MKKFDYRTLGRLKSGKKNKTEERYAAHLELLKSAGEILWYEFEPLNLRLADRCFYKVDFMVVTKDGTVEIHEVKGFMTDDALVKVKVAAEKFPFVFKVMKVRGKGWETREF